MANLQDDLDRLSLSRTVVADILLRVGSYSSAKDRYYEVASDILGSTSVFPNLSADGLLSTTYGSLSDDNVAEVMACCNGLAECEMKLGNKEKALLWLEEVRIVYLNIRTFRKPKLYDWEDWFPDTVAISVEYARAASQVGTLFTELGNTGTAAHRRWAAQNLIPTSHHAREPAIDRILSKDTTVGLCELRHPDPSTVHRSRVVNKSLQLLGSWKRLKIRKSGSPGRRMGFSGFIWDGHLYIAGGHYETDGPFYRDLLALDLAKLDAWKVMPDYPQPRERTGVFLGWHMIPCIEHKRAYLFTGRTNQLDYFDLMTKTWGSVNTKFIRQDPGDTAAGIRNPWPYPGNTLTDSTQQIFEEKLYVFGGTHRDTNIGCNLFMVLDLKTCTWTRLSGSVMAPKFANASTPGPRKTPSSWIDSKSKKFCLLFGECDQMGASIKGELHGSVDSSRAFDDFWTWDIAKGKWSKERFAGNAPCPRSEAACVYHPVLDKVIVWGGYNPDSPTHLLDYRMTFDFSYYADTFICDSSPRPGAASGSVQPRKWQQVLTKGFPTYRAQGQLLVDPQSGRMFLYGGYTNNDCIPSRHNLETFALGDVWELRINMPGGHFEGVDVADETRTAQAGPWQRCFTCGAAQFCRKCGGSCRGRAFFCDEDCFKEGWKEHKEVHGCRKVY